MHSSSDCWTLEEMDDLTDLDLKSNVLSLAMEVHRRLKNAYSTRAPSKSAQTEGFSRVANRLGLDEASSTEEFELIQVVPHDWSLQDIEIFRRLLNRHSERCCYERFPACERCPLIDLCPTGLANMRERDPARNEGAKHDFMFPL